MINVDAGSKREKREEKKRDVPYRLTLPPHFGLGESTCKLRDMLTFSLIFLLSFQGGKRVSSTTLLPTVDFEQEYN